MRLKDLHIPERTLFVLTGIVIGLGLSWIIGAGGESPERGYARLVNQGRVAQVGSAHGFELDDDREVRYQGVRAPYENEPMHDEAKQRNRQIVESKTVRLRYDEATHDRKGRINAYVFLEDGTLVNLVLVREGLAFARLTPDVQLFRADLLAAQLAARAGSLGIWERQPPSDQSHYPGDPKYAEFHRPTCEIVPRLDPGRRIDFATKDEAFDQGFTPCNKCLP